MLHRIGEDFSERLDFVPAHQAGFKGVLQVDGFAGSDGGGEHWAIIASLVETCKLSGVDPQAYLADTITKIASGHRNSHIDDLLPWGYAPPQMLKDLA